MNHWLTALIAGLCALLLLTAACGGDDDDDSADESGDEATSAGETNGDDGEATVEAEETDEAEPTEQSDDGGAPAGAIDACSLITSEEAAEAVGGPVEEPESSNIGENFHQCLWRIEGGTELDAAVVIQARPDTSPEEYAEVVEENCPEEIGGANPVEGLGDQAVECITVIVLEGDSVVASTVINDEPDAGAAATLEVAEIAIGRLP
jgi:hypothetical protein